MAIPVIPTRSVDTWDNKYGGTETQTSMIVAFSNRFVPSFYNDKLLDNMDNQ